jgi:hypothetical protein
VDLCAKISFLISSLLSSLGNSIIQQVQMAKSSLSARVYVSVSKKLLTTYTYYTVGSNAHMSMEERVCTRVRATFLIPLLTCSHHPSNNFWLKWSPVLRLTSVMNAGRHMFPRNESRGILGRKLLMYRYSSAICLQSSFIHQKLQERLNQIKRCARCQQHKHIWMAPTLAFGIVYRQQLMSSTHWQGLTPALS